jgi:hypothetical protein
MLGSWGAVRRLVPFVDRSRAVHVALAWTWTSVTWVAWEHTRWDAASLAHVLYLASKMSCMMLVEFGKDM